MHELSVAMGIVTIAEEEAKKASAKNVEVIELEIGTLSGIELEALDFVWPMAVKNTILEDADRRITIVQAIGKCMDCNIEFEVENICDACPHCGGFLKGIIKGKELRVKALEVS